MLDAEIFSINQWLIFIAIAMSGSLMIGYWRLKRSATKLEHELRQLRQEQQALLSGSVGLGRKIFQMKTNMELLEQSQEEQQYLHTSEKPIEQATKMLQMGAPLEEVMSSCRLSKGEAELLQQMLTAGSLH